MNIPSPLPFRITTEFESISFKKAEIESILEDLCTCSDEKTYKQLASSAQSLLSELQRLIDQMLIESQEMASDVTAKSILHTLNNFETDSKA
jgi:hypothetical protein